MPTRKTSFDVVGIGFGPANVALAIAREELFPDLDIVFLEARASSQWQPGMMFAHTDIQNHPLRDLVTPRNPQSRYSFTNFLFESDRLFEHLNLGMMFPMRTEYAQYIAWVARQFDHCVHYKRRVESVELNAGDESHPYRVRCRDGSEYLARAVVAAPGRTPYIPAVFDSARCERIVHLVDYLDACRNFLDAKPTARIAVVGGSQSAVEILAHLSATYPNADIVGFTRTFGYRQKDTSPFTGEVYFPEFVDLFFNADSAGKKRLRRDLHYTNYSAADADVLDGLYRTIYHQKIVGRQRLHIYRSADILAVTPQAEDVALLFKRLERHQPERETFDLVILATGFRDIGPDEHQEACPPILSSLSPYLQLDQQNCISISYDYSVLMRDGRHERNPCFVNGLCESSHGMGDAGSFSLLSLRSKTIADALARALGAGRKSPARPLKHMGSRI